MSYNQYIKNNKGLEMELSEKITEILDKHCYSINYLQRFENEPHSIYFGREYKWMAQIDDLIKDVDEGEALLSPYKYIRETWKYFNYNR